MTLVRMILPAWKENQGLRKVVEGEYSAADIAKYNADGYNIYYRPNYPSEYVQGTTVDGTMIDTFEWVFVDCDLKDGAYESKQEFIQALGAFDLFPTKVVDSGNGVHAYWRVSDLDAMSYLKLQRRLCRAFVTDEAVSTIAQLMRLPGTINTKNKDAQIPCVELVDIGEVYTCEALDKALPPITLADEKHCKQHYDKVYNLDRSNLKIADKLPAKFGELLHKNSEVKELFAGLTDDRSKNDYRLAHVMFANDFTKEEAAAVLVNSAKALARAPVHRISYAENIIDKIWTYEKTTTGLDLSDSVESILRRAPGDTLKGTRFACHKRIDNTEHGFRLGQVIGLVAGSGVGKTAFALNMFKWFTEANPDYHHFFIPLEQPSAEIADRWQTMCGENTSLHGKVHVLSNYDAEGNFRHLSLDELREYMNKWQKETGHKIGCVVIDHIGALKKKGAKDENQDLMTICHAMKAFAVQLNILLVMQSQTSREKAGIGDLELNKDAAYGTLFFESYCDYLITLWQPLKRMHSVQQCPTVTAFKFCKIRHKKARKDIIQEDVCYYFFFDSETELMRDLSQDEKVSFDYFLSQATNKRKLDRKTDLVAYQSVPYQEGAQTSVKIDSNRHSGRH